MEQLRPLSRSLQRWVVQLHNRHHRDSKHHFIAEGLHVIEELARSSFPIAYIVCTELILQSHQKLIEQFLTQGIPCYVTTQQIMERIADTRTPQGILAVVHSSYEHDWNALGNWIALDCITDPGNAGTIVRTARWFGFDGVILGHGSVDRFNTKFVRSTMGAFFHLPVIEGDLPEFCESVSNTHYIIGTTAHGGIPLATFHRPLRPFLLLIGNESHGLSPRLRDYIHEWITIEGTQNFESLNAAVAAGIIMYYLRPV